MTRFETTRNATKTPDHDRSDEQNSTVATTERATTTYVPTTRTSTESVTTTSRRTETILHEGSGSGTFNDISWNFPGLWFDPKMFLKTPLKFDWTPKFKMIPKNWEVEALNYSILKLT